MARYFFNVRDGQDFPDLEGVELATLAAARRHAARYAGELLQSSPDTFWSGAEWKMEVADARGLILFCLLFTGFDAAALSSAPTGPRA